jgi:hypothetical protein
MVRPDRYHRIWRCKSVLIVRRIESLEAPKDAGRPITSCDETISELYFGRTVIRLDCDEWVTGPETIVHFGHVPGIDGMRLRQVSSVSMTVCAG